MRNIGRTNEYPTKVQAGELPSGLQKFKHTLPWPIALEGIPFHFACYYDDTNYSDPTLRRQHNGIDIQVAAGTPIRLPETCKLIYCLLSADNDLTNMVLWGIKTKLEYYFVHLDPESIPAFIKSRECFDPDDVLEVQANEVIGRVGTWPLQLKDAVNIPSDVLPVFGRNFHHLHFELSYVPADPCTGKKYYFLSYDAKALNPLLLLKKL